MCGKRSRDKSKTSENNKNLHRGRWGIKKNAVKRQNEIRARIQNATVAIMGDGVFNFASCAFREFYDDRHFCGRIEKIPFEESRLHYKKYFSQ